MWCLHFLGHFLWKGVSGSQLMGTFWWVVEGGHSRGNLVIGMGGGLKSPIILNQILPFYSLFSQFCDGENPRTPIVNTLKSYLISHFAGHLNKMHKAYSCVHAM